MKKIFYLSIILFLTVLGLTGQKFLIKTAQAASPDDLIVVFKPNPLFGAVNFVPGQSVSGWVEVKNNSGATKSIITEAINVNDPAHLGDVLSINVILRTPQMRGTKDAVENVYFKGTLTQFFNAGQIFLSNLADNTTTTYEFIITFPYSAGNEYQGKTINNFDILIGFKGEEGNVVGGGGLSAGSRPSGGGGGSLPAGLTIIEGTVKTLEGATGETNVTITWLTSYFSTSRVIYSGASEGHIFDLSNIPNYGYAHSSLELDTPAIPNGKTFHKVTLTGLTVSTTYYYRVISHASPDTISQEFTFNTAGSPSRVLGEKTGLAETRTQKTPPLQEVSKLPLEVISQAPVSRVQGSRQQPRLFPKQEEQVVRESRTAFLPGQEPAIAGAREEQPVWPRWLWLLIGVNPLFLPISLFVLF